MKKINKICNFILLITIFSLGFIASKIVDVPGITIETNINPLHLLSIIVTLFIALLITVYFQTHKEVNSSRNEILIKRIDSITDNIDSFYDTISTGIIPIELAPSTVKRIYQSLKYTWENFNAEGVSVSIEFNIIEKKTRIINNLLTNTPAIASNDPVPPVSTAENNYLYNTARIAEIEKHIDDLKNNLFKVQLDVNKSIN